MTSISSERVIGERNTLVSPVDPEILWPKEHSDPTAYSLFTSCSLAPTPLTLPIPCLFIVPLKIPASKVLTICLFDEIAPSLPSRVFWPDIWIRIGKHMVKIFSKWKILIWRNAIERMAKLVSLQPPKTTFRLFWTCVRVFRLSSVNQKCGLLPWHCRIARFHAT